MAPIPTIKLSAKTRAPANPLPQKPAASRNDAHYIVVCTGNSARSIMAEAYMNHAGPERWRAYSAGSQPAGAPNPLALETLKSHNITAGPAPRSKSWSEFSVPSAPVMDMVVTVCDNAVGETCPIWPTHNRQAPKQRHWSFPDPAAKTGSDADKRAAFEEVFTAIKARIDAFLSGDHNRARQ